LFTGLILEMGEVTALARRAGGARLSLRAGAIPADAQTGDSISINGTCLTVVGIEGGVLSFDLSDETLRTTTLGRLRTGDRVNLEPSLRPDSKLGGHFVTGHIDGVGKIKSKTLSGEAYKILISAEPRVTGYLVEKGSVAVDGISLTVVEALGDSFSIVIIPHTAKVTTIGLRDAGDSVNLEVDILAKYVSKFLGSAKDSRFMQSLVEGGFA